MKTIWKRVAFCMAVILSVSSIAAVRTADAAPKGYLFKYKGVSVSADSAAKKFIKKAGKPQKKQAKKSCAYKGKDRIYQYRDFWLTTYSKTDKGPEYVQQIKLRTKKVKTKEGIKIGDKASKVVKKYGKGYDESSFLIDNAYVYQKGNCTLQFKIKKNKVSGISYMQTKVK